MLTPDYLYHIGDKAVDLWEQLNVFAVRDICRRIADAMGHMTASADWQKYKLLQAGMTMEDIKAQVQKTLKLSDRQVKELFEEAIHTSYSNDAKVLAEAGINAPDQMRDKQTQKLLEALYRQTNGEIHNLTRTTANASQTVYINACDSALLRIKSGLQSPEQAVTQAIDEVSTKGLSIIYPTGWSDSIETAVRRSVMTGANRASLQMCVDECRATGTNYVIVSSHLGARVSDTNPIANHAGWQGGIYKLANRRTGFWGALEHFNDIVKKQNYPLLEDATGYPSDPLGLGGYNCRHSMYPYIPGITENHMQQFDPDKNRKVYEASQKQRSIEQKIRRIKRNIEGLEAAISTTSDRALTEQLTIKLQKAKADLKVEMAYYKVFCKDNNLALAYGRTNIAR